MYRAHSENKDGAVHDLNEHLKSVAELAAGFARRSHGGRIAYCGGLLHDIGKFSQDFQNYITSGVLKHGPDHSSAGSIVAAQAFEPLAFLVAGHHSGLPSLSQLKSRLRDKASDPQVGEAVQRARDAMVQVVDCKALQANHLPGSLRQGSPGRGKRNLEMFVRMVFSALVDADYLDTEQHFYPQRPSQRESQVRLDDLWARFELDQTKVTGRRHDTVNRARHEIYQHCLKAAELPPGIFRLTVPTGGGKTRSAMAFALRHALRHNLDRTIVAIPYLSITDQTAALYRQIFGDECVLEHHSGVSYDDEDEDPKQLWARMACENWSAPIIVTTTVQLFESLFSNKPSACRKLHNIAGSVLILDEVQTLPVHLLEPILDVLQQLAANYSVTAVLSTATQPALDDSPYLRGLRDVREIIPDPARYFHALERVHYELHVPGERWSWQRVAEEMRRAETETCLAVVNTIKDASSLLDALDDPAAFHLSTRLCGAHRRDVLAHVRQCLHAGEPCRLVSTQVVEAGVDLDFPLVLRAVGPLDSIVQAAGRCNREGRLGTEGGRVVVFEPQDGHCPPGAYRTATDTGRMLMSSQACDLNGPALYRTYFQRLYQAVSLDERKIQPLREVFNYPEVAKKFRMIDDDTVPVVVRPPGASAEVDHLLALARGATERALAVIRRLQPYLVNVRQARLRTYEEQGLLREVLPGLWEWLGRYDPIRGLTGEGPDPADLVV